MSCHSHGQSPTAQLLIPHTVASPKGVFLQIWPQVPDDLKYTSCNNTGGVLVEMPTIPAGKTKA
jgi:invasion protein IalB